MFNWSQKMASIVFGVSALVMGGAVSTPASAAAEVDDYRECGKTQSGCTGARAVKIERETPSGNSIYQNIVRADESYYDGSSSSTSTHDQQLIKDDGSWQVSQRRQSYEYKSSDGSSVSVKEDRVWVEGDMKVNRTRIDY